MKCKTSLQTSSNMTATQAVLFLVTLVCLMDHSSNFQSNFDQNSSSHIYITQTAILQKTAEVCRDIAASENRSFSLNITQSLSADDVQAACTSGPSTAPISSFNFQASISSIILSNARVDLDFAQSENHHFYNEAFQGGRDIITACVAAVKQFVKEGNYLSGRQNLGHALHILQDFYSHSNWVELGNGAPYGSLIKPDEDFVNLADPSTPTCRNCTGDDCTNNLLEQDLLTSGYFSMFSSVKPSGKCSHGGPFDNTSKSDPEGGISKDDNKSSHGFLHYTAADLAFKASMELLEDIRLVVGDRNFLRFMGLRQGNVLCFVIDTTGSMGDDIFFTTVVYDDIIASRQGTEQEPSAYILVPFNDPDFGPVTMTTDPDVFRTKLHALVADGGGDRPEFSFSGLQLALTAAPHSSELFLFTDAPPKDSQLKNTIAALIETTKSVVNFLLTIASEEPLTPTEVQVYGDLAELSGGQAIVISKDELFNVQDIIKESSTSAVVTVFWAIRSDSNTFTFTVDSSLSNMVAYITGPSSLIFTVTSSRGVSQSSSQSDGPLGSFVQTRNFYRLGLKTESQTELWSITVTANDLYSIRVTGQSSLDFMYELVEIKAGVHESLALKTGRPLVGDNVTALITVTGNVPVNITEIIVVENSGSTEVNGSQLSFGRLANNIYLLTVTGIPEGKFVIALKGESSGSQTSFTPSSFQRWGTTQIETSNVSVTTQPNIPTIIEPGSSIPIPFIVAVNTNGNITDSTNRTFLIQVNNDRNFDVRSPDSVTVEAGSGGKANSNVTLTVPASTASGTDVTITIQAQNKDSADINYNIIKFSVASKVTDVAGPVFNVSKSGNCTSPSFPCESMEWGFVANITDGMNGSGVDSVFIRQGSGSFSSTVVGAGGEDITVATYRSNCCSQVVDVVAVDKVGNVRTLTLALRDSLTVVPVTTPVTTSVATSVATSATTPVTTPVATPVTTPVATSVVTSVATSVVTSAATSATTSVTTSVTTSATTPITTSVTTPVATSVVTSATTSATTPITTSVTTPIATSVATSATTPITAPITAPVTAPVTTEDPKITSFTLIGPSSINVTSASETIHFTAPTSTNITVTTSAPTNLTVITESMKINVTILAPSTINANLSASNPGAINVTTPTSRTVIVTISENATLTITTLNLANVTVTTSASAPHHHHYFTCCLPIILALSALLSNQ